MVPAKQDQDIVVQVTKNFKEINFSLNKLKKLVNVVCHRFASSHTPNTKYEISIAIVDDAQIIKLNNQFLNRKTTTDCLSFDLTDEQGPAVGNTGSRILELVVNGEMAVRQANLRGHSSEAELALYVTHGLLHNLGFDDSAQTQARTMHDTEDEILQQLGYGLVYNTDI